VRASPLGIRRIGTVCGRNVVQLPGMTGCVKGCLSCGAPGLLSQRVHTSEIDNSEGQQRQRWQADGELHERRPALAAPWSTPVSVHLGQIGSGGASVRVEGTCCIDLNWCSAREGGRLG
jgi:hypothetical protein